MKVKNLIRVLAIGVLLALPICANAGIIGTVNLNEAYSSPIGKVHFPIHGTNNYYLDYDASLNGAAYSESFCVEDTDGPPSGNHTYTLLSIDSSLSGFFTSYDARYLAAAWVADKYLNGVYGNTTEEDKAKAGAQIAIWEIIFDYNTLNLSSGNFWSDSNNSYNAQAQSFLNALQLQQTIGGLPTSNNRWALAVNPPITTGEKVDVTEEYQNYLVQRVPEPGSTLLLLGMAFLPIALTTRWWKK